MSREYDFHPIADEYPLMSAHDLGRMEQGMVDRGFDDWFPIVIFQGKILDGRNRYLAAKAAKVEPVYEQFNGNEDEARLFVMQANEERRHLAAEWLQTRRKERIERVVKRRQEGESLRTIAEEEGVSLGQVQRDLDEASTVSGDTVEPEDGKVEGRDGRTRTAHPEKAEKQEPQGPSRADMYLWCTRCTAKRKQVVDCPACRENRERAEAEDAEKKPAPEVDADGREIPEHVLPAFAAARALTALARRFDELIADVKAMATAPGGRCIRIESVEQHLKEAKGVVWANRATHVCPYCKAEKPRCEACKGEGWVPKHVWQQAPGTNGKKL